MKNGITMIAVVTSALLIAGCATSPVADVRPIAEDPVCLFKGDLACVSVRVDDQTPRAIHNGTTYYFCAEGCRREFVDHPEKFVRFIEQSAAKKKPR